MKFFKLDANPILINTVTIPDYKTFMSLKIFLNKKLTMHKNMIQMKRTKKIFTIF